MTWTRDVFSREQKPALGKLTADLASLSANQ